MGEKKIKLGQFNTKSDLWLKPQVIDFINNSKCKDIKLRVNKKNSTALF